MKYMILATALLLAGCGGGGSSSTPTVVTEVVEVPVIERECEEPETIYVVEEVIVEANNTVPDCPVCPEVPVVEPEIVTYYQKSTTILNGEPSEEYTYTDDGFILSYNRLDNNYIQTYVYDENNNILSKETHTDGNLTRYEYYTFDENNNTLTHITSDGMSVVYTYTDNNLRETVKVSQDGVLVSDFRNTYEGENLIKREYYIANRVNKFDYDSNDNLIYYGIWLNGELTDEYTYTWQEFTEVI